MLYITNKFDETMDKLATDKKMSRKEVEKIGMELIRRDERKSKSFILTLLNYVWSFN